MRIAAMNRRRFLTSVGRTGAVGAMWQAGTAGQGRSSGSADGAVSTDTTWEDVRRLFELRSDRIHMAGMVIASHPAPVASAIEQHRAALQADPVRYIDENRWRFEAAVLNAAGHYLQAAAEDIALTDSTSMGLGLLYTGLRLSPGDEILTTTHDHYATETALAECAARTGCVIRRIAMYRDLATVTEDELVASVRDAVSARTRVLALTWVHSGTGLKIPIARIGGAIEEVNRQRDDAERIRMCVDGVHALGIEDFTLPQLQCDFWAAGTHKWLFGPRGTGVLWGRREAWNIVRATIPTWEPAAFQSWIGWKPRAVVGGGQTMTPGGYHSFDHRWALGSAFVLHEQLGKVRVQNRIHALNRQLKEGLQRVRGVRLYTPMHERLSSGIVCFDVGTLPAQSVVDQLFERGIVASRTPYKTSYARLCPSLLTLERDVERTLEAIRALA